MVIIYILNIYIVVDFNCTVLMDINNDLRFCGADLKEKRINEFSKIKYNDTLKQLNCNQIYGMVIARNGEVYFKVN